MKFFILIFLVLFSITSCQTEEKTLSKKVSEKKKSKEEEISPLEETTAIPIMTFSRYEDPFYEDTLKMELPITKIKRIDFDSMFTLMYQFSASYPQSKLKEHERFNKLVREKVEKYFKEHIIENGSNFGGFSVSAQFDATDFELNTDYAGILFTDQDYFDGAAHFNHGYHSFHFDFKKNKEIKLTDILVFKKGEAQKFSDAFNPDPTTTINETMLEGGDFTADRPFLTNYGELYLYFSDYEKGPSMTRVIIPYSKFKGYVNPEYKYLFED